MHIKNAQEFMNWSDNYVILKVVDFEFKLQVLILTLRLKNVFFSDFSNRWSKLQFETSPEVERLHN